MKPYVKTIFYLVLFTLTLTSCNKDNLSELTAIQIKLVNSNVEQPVDTPFEFLVEGNNQENVSDQVTLKVNGENYEINGTTTFVSSIAGDYNLQAFYKDFESNVLTVKVVNPSEYVQRVLVEDYTGTWCGWCPRIAYAIGLCKEQSDKVISVAVHSDDVYEFQEAADMMEEFNIVGLPEGRINRIHVWNKLHEHESLNEVLDKTGFNASLGLAIESEIQNNTIQANLRVGFAEGFDNPLNIVVYLTESGLNYDQTNYTEFYGGENTIVDFEHKDVLRAITNGIYGEAIPSGETIEDHIYTKSMTITIPDTIEDVSQFHIVAFVIDQTTKEVINVQEANVEENVGF